MIKLTQFKKFNLPIHLILFALYPILFFVSYNKGQLFLINRDTFNLILITLFISILLWLLLSIILKEVVKSAIVVSLFLILFFSYGHAHSTIGDFNYEILSFDIGKDKVLFSMWAFILFIGSFALIKTRRNLNKLTKFLNIIAALLVIFSLVDIVYFEFGTRKETNSKLAEGGREGQMALQIPQEPPDIYYIIFDAYPSSNTLKEIYDYDNHALDNFLTEKGFFVASESRSNYAHTHFSLPSSLNMRYINYLSGELGIDSKDTTIPKSMIEKNKVADSLKSLGYKYIHIGSEYQPTSQNRYADINVVNDGSSIEIAGQSYRLDEFYTTFIKTTWLSPFVNNFLENDVREQRLNSLNKVSELVSTRGPKFVFAHLTISHPPPYFDAEGSPLSKAELEQIGSVYKDKENNLNQIIFVGEKMKEMVQNIFKKSKTEPIIIFQADHGPTSLLGHPHHWKRPFEKNIRGINERLSILNAYYLPNGGDKLLYDSISPVNTFRVIFNYYFDANYKLLPDKTYYSDHINQYEFFDVTEKVK